MSNEYEHTQEEEQELNQEIEEEQIEEGAPDDEQVEEPSGEDDLEENRAPEWVRKLRKSEKKLKKENRRLEREHRKLRSEVDGLKNPSLASGGPKDPGPRPKISDQDIDHDEDVYETKLDQWLSDKQAYEKHKEKTEQSERQQQKAFQERIDAYNSKRSALEFEDLEEIEANVDDEFDQLKLAIMMQVSDNAPLLKYEIGSNDELLEELSSIEDPAKFAYELAKVEMKMSKSTTKKRAVTAPEKQVKGRSSAIGSYEKELERLREEAEKTGNYSKVIAYKKSRKAR